MATIADLKALANEIGKIAYQYVINEFKAQGHTLTGAFEQQVEFKVVDTISATFNADNSVTTKRGLRIDFLMPYYGRFVDTGVPASRIPFTDRKSGQGKGGTSKYIEALIRYAKLRMGASSQKEATQIAFAIARKHKKEGMPTKASSRFSQTGLRTDFIDESKEAMERELLAYVKDYAEAAVQILFQNAFKTI